jgi:hypothetical protein
MIELRDVLTEDEWRDLRIRMPTPFEFVKSKRKYRGSGNYKGRYREYLRILPHPEGYKEWYEAQAMYSMLPRIGYRTSFAVFDRS